MNTTPSSHPHPSQGSLPGRALVLGGGGSTGNAWLIGVLAGLAAAGLDVTRADRVIGTSAGSTAAAQIAGAPPAELYAAILDAPLPPQRRPAAGHAPARPVSDHLERTGKIIAAAKDPADMRSRMGAVALEMAAARNPPTQTVSVQDSASPAGSPQDGPVQERSVQESSAQGGSLREQWRATVATRLPTLEWPQHELLMTAVDAHTGEPVVFHRHSGVDLVDAVAASCASGFAYGIGNGSYIDGGYRRNENADLAAGCGRVLVLSPFGGRTRMPLEWNMQLAAQADELRASGSVVETVFPDAGSEHMFGANAMDLRLRPAAAQAGYNQGKALAGRLASFWS
ncbi:patatin-like phospholipase family protein [Pseudarthrobacter sp. efr-133-R2A-89]|uniref:patatin-like phospholipase family protein n=1 Tax=Pseudarthrobacter sp. efr-133-R2A-89 TaxID=3040302 RepID=UPI002552E848|nr:patatin-like phospholipase family protein [Pseudarthrobacter sp. efr-133-R2A-89]